MSSIHLKRIGLESIDLVQSVLDDSKTYYLNVEGISKWEGAAKRELTLLPPGFPVEKKIDFLIYADLALIGFADLLQEYPVDGTWMLGLLIVAEPHQGKALGRSAYEVIERAIKEHSGSNKVRIGVNDSNPVQLFWEKLGFRVTGEEKPYQGIQKDSWVKVMEKELGPF